MNSPFQTVTALKSQTRPHKLYEYILLTLFGVLMYVSQVLMAALTNIEIVSLLIIVTTKKFGVKALLSVYIFVFCEIFTYGLSMWVINYLYVWAILWLAVWLIRKTDSAAVYTILSALFGILFGTFCSIPYFLTGGFSGGIAYIISGFWYDILHCVGNFITTAVLYIPIKKILDKLIK